jgi:signal transduction histidine kinase
MVLSGPAESGSLFAPEDPYGPGGTRWLFTLERRAVLPVKWLMSLLCTALVIFRAPDLIPPLPEFSLLAFYVATNTGFSYLIYFNRVTPEQLRPVSMISFAVDVFTMSGFIYLTGGIDSDFFILFFLVILRGMGFFPTAGMNVAANLVVAAIYIGSLVLAGYDQAIMQEQEFYQKVLLVMGVVFLSWFLIEIQSRQYRHLYWVNLRLEFERAYVENLLESMTDGVVALNSEGDITTVNSSARTILEWSSKQNEPPVEAAREIPEPILSACHRVLDGQGEVEDETLDIRVGPQNRVKTIRLSARRLRGAEEGPGGAVAIFEDLSTLQKIEEQLWQSEKLASIGQLAAGVAHELGNPIGIIKACAEYLQGCLKKTDEPADLRSEVSEEIEVIQSESTRCQRILKELLSYSAREKVERGSLDLVDILRRSEHLVSYQAPKDRVQVELDIPQGPVYVLADTNLLTQALVNILLNAVESIEPEQKGRVTIRLVQSSSRPKLVGVEIEDTGRGIAPERIENIFEPFYTSREEGTGLGLAITQRIMERLSGQVEVKSEPGRGACFTLWLEKSEESEHGNQGKVT